MAEKKETAVKAEKTKKIRLPRISGPIENQDQYVALNGKPYIIKRGIEVEVPIAVAEILEHSAIAEDKAAEYAEQVAVKEPKK